MNSVSYSRIMAENKYYPFFELLATPLRMGIISLLKDSEALCVKDICESLGEEQSKVSHALKRLRECNAVWVEKKGNFRYYSLNKVTIIPMLELIDRHVMSYCAVCRHLGEKDRNSRT